MDHSHADDDGVDLRAGVPKLTAVRQLKVYGFVIAYCSSQVSVLSVGVGVADALTAAIVHVESELRLEGLLVEQWRVAFMGPVFESATTAAAQQWFADQPMTSRRLDITGFLGSSAP